MLITALNEGKSERAEAVLDTMRAVGIRYYRAAPFRYDYSGDLAQQIDALKPRIGSLVTLNEKYGTTAMYHTHSAYGNIGGGVWDLWLAVKDFDPQFVGLNYDLGHATIRGGTGWIETSHISHTFVHGLSVKDFRWVKSGTSATARNTGGRRSGNPSAAPAPQAPWTPEMARKEARRLLDLFPKSAEKARFPLLPAYEHVLKCSHLFNTLDSRGAISVTERVGVIARVRKLAVGTAGAARGLRDQN